MSPLVALFSRLFKISDGGSLQRLQRLWQIMKPQWRLFAAAGLCALLAIPLSLAEPLVTRVIFDEAVPQRDLALLGKLRPSPFGTGPAQRGVLVFRGLPADHLPQ